MKKLINVAFIIAALTSFIFALYLAIMPTAMNREFYYNIYANENFEIYKKQGTGLNRNVTLPKEEINKALDHTLKYMLAEVDDLQVEITFSDGTKANFYTETELSHMDDCQVLFVGGTKIAYTCLATLILCVGFLIYQRKKINSKQINFYFIGLAGIVVAMGFVGVYAVIDFNRAFTIFHQIFFPQGNWQFSYNSYMIQMLPSDLIFQQLAYKIIITFFIIIVAVIASLVFLKKYLQKQESLKSFQTN